MFEWLFGKKNKIDDNVISELEEELEKLSLENDENYIEDGEFGIGEDELGDFLTQSRWTPQDFEETGIENGLSYIGFGADLISFSDEVSEVMVHCEYSGLYELDGGFDFDRLVYEVRVLDVHDGSYILKEPAKNRIQFEIELKKAVREIKALL